MILYATVAVWVFFETRIYLAQMHWFLLGLSAVQFGISQFHRSLGTRERGLYIAAGVTLATLGVLSGLQGLTLNLILGAEALLLLVCARQLNMWFLNPLAQVVLAVNFVHFWTSDARQIDTGNRAGKTPCPITRPLI